VEDWGLFLTGDFTFCGGCCGVGGGWVLVFLCVALLPMVFCVARIRGIGRGGVGGCSLGFGVCDVVFGFARHSCASTTYLHGGCLFSIRGRVALTGELQYLRWLPALGIWGRLKVVGGVKRCGVTAGGW